MMYAVDWLRRDGPLHLGHARIFGRAQERAQAAAARCYCANEDIDPTVANGIPSRWSRSALVRVRMG